ncbi:T9SS type A sorting domain-containing protein [bacterium]|nr:T9SS type A sorting domain-containing protein [bacterium]
MKNFLAIASLFLAFLFLPVITLSQVVTFEPSFATQNDTLTLTFDATQGNGELAGFSGDVYLHTGLITDKSSSPSDWKYVQSGWESYPAKLKATPLGNDKWEFKYPSSVREFYNVSAADKAEEITLLFRGTLDGAGAPDKVGRASGGEDIFLELFENEVSVQFLNPGEKSKIVKTNEEIEIEGIGNSPAGNLNLSLKLNGTEVAQTSVSDTVRYVFSAESEGNYRFDLIGDDGAGEEDSTSVTIIVTDGAVMEARPAGLEDGITYGENGTSVTLSLFAPGKREVFVVGDFSDWELDFNYQMKKDSLKADSVWFWTEITGLIPGEEYGFQYEIDGSLRIADPYSELVLHPNDDNFISESIFPNLKEYPNGKTTNYVGVLFPGKTPYQWEATSYERPKKEDLVIYELLVRDFLADHSYASLIDTLDYLDRLGINAIELMPVNEFDGNESWGYNPSFHLALDKYYGTPDKFREFIDEAHKRGIAVILDVVMNHATGQNSLYRMYEVGSNPYFNVEAKHEFNVFNDFNHQYSGTQYYNKKMIEHWINEYNIDGFRWDLTKGFTQNCSPAGNGCTSSYQQDRVDLLKKYADHQWAADPDFYVIFEHLGTSNEEKQWADYRVDEGKGIMLWGNMNHPYNEATMGYTSNSNLYGVLSESRGFQEERLIGYMESHDEQWLMFKNISFGNSSGDYNIKELNTALGRQKLAGAFFFTLPGPKMIWQFGEVGYGYGDNGEQCLNDSEDCPASAPGRVANKPIRWDYWNTKGTERVKLYKTWAALINLRNSSPAFTEPESTTYALSNRIKRIILEHSDTDVVVVGNFDVTAITTTGDFPQLGTWYDYFEGSEYDVTDSEQAIKLEPGEFKVYTTKQFDAPEMGIATSTEELPSEGPESFKLYNNYPNPFNPSTNIKFDVAKTGVVKLEVFDILGRKVATLFDGKKSVGTHTLTFDASSLSSGVYFTRFTAGNTVQVQKMTLLK